MAQIKVFGLGTMLNTHKRQLSDVLHACVVESLKLPSDKRFHRFFPMSVDNFYYPEGRSERYTIIEISIFEGRSVETKKKLIRLIFQRLEASLGIGPKDVEITILETPSCNWGIRGMTGDELQLDYKVDV